MSITLTFCGAAGTVTGSKYFLEAAGRQLLVDAGMFQGERLWRDRNWQDPPFVPSKIQAVLLTHAHLDHSGMLPRYVAQGLDCPVYCTEATRSLLEILLLDSGRLQEEEVEYRSRGKRSRHDPVLPLYTEADARRSLELVRVVPFGRDFELLPGVRAYYSAVGHMLGAGSIVCEIGGKRITFSGDIGRYGQPILNDPAAPEGTYGDLLLIESTYGDRQHPDHDIAARLADVVNRTIRRGGTLLIPSFAVGRAQALLYYFTQLKNRKEIPDVPVIIDSPMATRATEIYASFRNELREDLRTVLAQHKDPFAAGKMRFTRDRDESIALNSIDAPMVLISASGMLSGGRILHHLKHRVSDPRTTILFVGHQPAGGRGDWLLRGAKSMRLFGQEITVRAQVEEISGLSAHGDRDELLRWCRSGNGKPKRTAVVHGELGTAQAFAGSLQRELGWESFVAEYQQKITL